MNNTYFIGRLVTDPELRETESGKKVVQIVFYISCRHILIVCLLVVNNVYVTRKFIIPAIRAFGLDDIKICAGRNGLAFVFPVPSVRRIGK